jgi:nucleotide-binding universal stress UspA family protein
VAGPLRSAGLSVETRVLVNNDPARAIVDYARDMHPDFVVMLRRTHPGIGEIVFGSIASRVAHADVAPVLFVPSA